MKTGTVRQSTLCKKTVQTAKGTKSRSCRTAGRPTHLFGKQLYRRTECSNHEEHKMEIVSRGVAQTLIQSLTNNHGTRNEKKRSGHQSKDNNVEQVQRSSQDVSFQISSTEDLERVKEELEE